MIALAPSLVALTATRLLLLVGFMVAVWRLRTRHWRIAVACVLLVVSAVFALFDARLISSAVSIFSLLATLIVFRDRIANDPTQIQAKYAARQDLVAHYRHDLINWGTSCQGIAELYALRLEEAGLPVDVPIPSKPDPPPGLTGVS